MLSAVNVKLTGLPHDDPEGESRMSVERIKLLENVLMAYVERYGLTPEARRVLCTASPGPEPKAMDIAQPWEADFFLGNETGPASLAPK